MSDSAQQSFFRVTDSIPEETWYWLSLGSIGISAVLKLMQKDNWALFVGQWPPTFLLFGLYLPPLGATRPALRAANGGVTP